MVVHSPSATSNLATSLSDAKHAHEKQWMMQQPIRYRCEGHPRDGVIGRQLVDS